jgi:N-acetylglutamate synthase-like GNAT family acetyltransferase
MGTTGTFQVCRAKPSDAQAITGFLASATGGRVSVAPQVVKERFGAKGLWLARDADGKIVGLAGWRAENLVARIDDFLVFPAELYSSAGRMLIEGIEKAAQELQCEVSMIFVPLRAASGLVAFYQTCGYRRPKGEDLPRVWRQTIEEATERGRFVMLKQLREDLVLRPM